MIRNKLGQFRTRLHSAYDAGWDSVVSGPDIENCNFAWFMNGRTEDWQKGHDDAKRYLDKIGGAGVSPTTPKLPPPKSNQENK